MGVVDDVFALSSSEVQPLQTLCRELPAAGERRRPVAAEPARLPSSSLASAQTLLSIPHPTSPSPSSSSPSPPTRLRIAEHARRTQQYHSRNRFSSCWQLISAARRARSTADPLRDSTATTPSAARCSRTPSLVHSAALDPQRLI